MPSTPMLLVLGRLSGELGPFLFRANHRSGGRSVIMLRLGIRRAEKYMYIFN